MQATPSLLLLSMIRLLLSMIRLLLSMIRLLLSMIRLLLSMIRLLLSMIRLNAFHTMSLLCINLGHPNHCFASGEHELSPLNFECLINVLC